jgi:hypothetical protein|uniref:Uncharacterized protein n=1 Tax=Eutreptiella gymnastica TaxID=73025 RepID=A0A7S4GAS1_9EUGL
MQPTCVGRRAIDTQLSHAKWAAMGMAMANGCRTWTGLVRNWVRGLARSLTAQQLQKKEFAGWGNVAPSAALGYHQIETRRSLLPLPLTVQFMGLGKVACPRKTGSGPGQKNYNQKCATTHKNKPKSLMLGLAWKSRKDPMRHMFDPKGQGGCGETGAL